MSATGTEALEPPLSVEASAGEARGSGSSGSRELPCAAWRSSPVLTIAFHNERGGVGKTSLVRALGFSLRHAGFKVLVVDLDPNHELTSYLLDDTIKEMYGDDFHTFVQNYPSDPAAGGSARFPETRFTVKQMVYPLEVNQDGSTVGVRTDSVDYVYDCSDRDPLGKEGGELKLLCGDSQTSRLEEMLSDADNTLGKSDKVSEVLLRLRAPAVGAIQAVIQSTAHAKFQNGPADVILLDLPGTASRLSFYGLFSSHYIVIAACANKSSAQGIRSIARSMSGAESIFNNLRNYQDQPSHQGLGEAEMKLRNGGWLYRLTELIRKRADVEKNKTKMLDVIPKYLGFVAIPRDATVKDAKKSGKYENGVVKAKWPKEVKNALVSLKDSFTTKLRTRLAARSMVVSEKGGKGQEPLGDRGCIGVLLPGRSLELRAAEEGTEIAFIQQRGDPRADNAFRTRMQLAWTMLTLIQRDNWNQATATPRLRALSEVPPVARDGTPFSTQKQPLCQHHPWTQRRAKLAEEEEAANPAPPHSAAEEEEEAANPAPPNSAASGDEADPQPKAKAAAKKRPASAKKKARGKQAAAAKGAAKKGARGKQGAQAKALAKRAARAKKGARGRQGAQAKASAKRVASAAKGGAKKRARGKQGAQAVALVEHEARPEDPAATSLEGA